MGAVWNLGSFIKLCDTRLPGRNCMMGKGWDVFNLESEVFMRFHAFASPYWTGHARSLVPEGNSSQIGKFCHGVTVILPSLLLLNCWQQLNWIYFDSVSGKPLVQSLLQCDSTVTP